MSEAASFYRHLKELFGTDPGRGQRRSARSERAASRTGSQPFEPGREPRGLGLLIDSLADELGWTSPLAKSELISAWSDVVGDETAKHSEPAGIEQGVLTVRCDSTGWATQLRLMRGELLVHIERRFPQAGVESIRFLGPDVPSWKRGPRSVPGRGPRDTYG
jgi:predicted nucleic acid-binding Zn ribbon protein